MSELKDFDTLADAQSFSVTTYTKITAGQSMQYFGMNGILSLLESNTANTTVINLSATVSTTVGDLCKTVLASATGTGFASDPNTEDGYANRGAAQLLLGAGIFPSQAIVDGFWAKGTVTTYPHANATQTDFDEAKDTGETIELTDNPTQHQVKFKIATSPSKPTSIVIEQQFGDTLEDLTPWHSVGSVSVQYKQSTYKLMVPASTTAIRKLRAVSPLTLGLSEII